jgi:hypothetical protein
VVAGNPDSWGLACPIDQREEKRKARGPKLGETQKADRFWFAPGAAKKAGQWRLRASRCCNHAGLFLDRLKHRSCAPSTENAKSGEVLVRNRGGEKGRQWRLRTSRCCNHAGLFLDRLKHRSRAPSTENAKSGQVLVRTREDKTESIDYFKGVCQEF